MLRGLRKPVILTGSQIPLTQPRSDALQNIVTALRFAASDDISEVAICFNQCLLRGNRATKISASRFQAFDSPAYPWLGEAGIDLVLHRAALLPKPPVAAERFELPDYVAGGILPLRFVPGLPLRTVQALIDLQPQALILEGYGAGNVPDRDPALLALLAQAHRNGTVVAVVSQSLHGEVALGAYATGSSLARTGAIGMRDMRFEAVFAKLHHLFATGLTPESVRAALLQNLCGELTL
jgi:L-asparaginase